MSSGWLLGLPLAVEFGKKFETIGYGLSEQQIASYKSYCDPTGEVSFEDLKAAQKLSFTTDPTGISKADFIFKEDCLDLRNSRVVDIIRELKGYGLEVYVHDPMAEPAGAKHEYGLELMGWEELPKADAVVGAVAHRPLIERPVADFSEKLKEGAVFIDVKSKYDCHALVRAGFRFWRL